MKSIVYYNPEETPIKYEISGFTLYFSSICDKNRFIKLMSSRLEDNNLKLKAMYKCEGNFTCLLIPYYYQIAEKRIFKIKYLDKDITKDYSVNISLK